MTRQDNPVVRLRTGNTLKQPAETKRKAPAGAGAFLFCGGPEGDRTLDLTDANRALIPAELRARAKIRVA